MKTAPGSLDGTGYYVSEVSLIDEIKNADNQADYRHSVFGTYDTNGRALSGDEYYTVFAGDTGEAFDTIYYLHPRGTIEEWGDNWGNRSERYLAGVAYLDGQTPSMIAWREYYAKTTATAYNLVNKRLVQTADFDTSKSEFAPYAGNGNHNLTIADVDNDGCDEVFLWFIVIRGMSGSVAEEYAREHNILFVADEIAVTPSPTPVVTAAPTATPSPTPTIAPTVTPTIRPIAIPIETPYPEPEVTEGFILSVDKEASDDKTIVLNIDYAGIDQIQSLSLNVLLEGEQIDLNTANVTFEMADGFSDSEGISKSYKNSRIIFSAFSFGGSFSNLNNHFATVKVELTDRLYSYLKFEVASANLTGKNEGTRVKFATADNSMVKGYVYAYTDGYIAGQSFVNKAFIREVSY